MVTDYGKGAAMDLPPGGRAGQLKFFKQALAAATAVEKQACSR